MCDLGISYYLDLFEYGEQEMPQSRLIDQHMAPRGRGYRTKTAKDTHMKR